MTSNKFVTVYDQMEALLVNIDEFNNCCRHTCTCNDF